MQVFSPRFSGVHIIHEHCAFENGAADLLGNRHDAPMQDMFEKMEDKARCFFRFSPSSDTKHWVNVFITDNQNGDDEQMKRMIESAVKESRTNKARCNTRYHYLDVDVPKDTAEALAKIATSKEMGLPLEAEFKIDDPMGRVILNLLQLFRDIPLLPRLEIEKIVK